MVRVVMLLRIGVGTVERRYRGHRHMGPGDVPRRLRSVVIIGKVQMVLQMLNTGMLRHARIF